MHKLTKTVKTNSKARAFGLQKTPQIRKRKAIAMKRTISKGKGRRLLTGKGLYITLAACAAAVGGAGLAAYDQSAKEINKKLDVSFPDVSYTEIDEKLEGVLRDDSRADSESVADREDSSSAADMDVKTAPNVMPVNGEILNPFSKGELVKSETLDVWKTHDGVDIKAEKGTLVRAMNKGRVIEIMEDALWGNCILIDHGNGVIGHYYNLSPEMMVHEGDEVTAGQTIGSVGDTASCEAAELSHLHFALKKNGEWIDPIAYIDPASAK